MWRRHVVTTAFQLCAGESREESPAADKEGAEAHEGTPQGSETMTQPCLSCWGSGTALAGSKR